MRINVAIPEAHVSAPVLDAALEGVTRLNEQLIRSGTVPPIEKVIHRIRWKPEPPGQEHFDHAGIVVNRGFGDCDDISPFYAGTLRASGKDPGARAVVRKSGPKRWHVVVRRSNGTIEDPNLDAGMPGTGRGIGINGAVLPVMFSEPPGINGAYVSRPQLALRPFKDRWGQLEAWQARADLPWHWQGDAQSPGEIAMVSLHRSPVSSQSIVGACRGAVRLGEASGFADEEHLDRLSAIADACEGVGWEDLAEEYGPEHATAAGQLVGSFFGRMVRKAGGVMRPMARFALPIASKALPFIPGVGPVASLALQSATPMLQRALAERRHEPPQARAMPVPPQQGYGYGPPTGYAPPGGGYGPPQGYGAPQGYGGGWGAPQGPYGGWGVPQGYGPPQGYAEPFA